MAVFDLFATDYDSWYETGQGKFVDSVETELVFRLLEVEKGMKVLDFGCGTGNFSIKLAELGCKVVGVDVSEGMLRIARKKAAQHRLNILFIKIEAENLPFDDGEFDAVVSVAAFEFIRDEKRVFRELLRVVKPGGQVLVGTIAGDSAWGELYKSEEFSDNTVFRDACFKTLDDLKSWDRERLARTGECLFVSPLAEVEELNIDRENELAGTRKGGFICAVWRK